MTGFRGSPYSVDPLDRIHHHHIVELSRGGKDTTSNIVSVSRTVHDLLHQNRIVVKGDADLRLCWSNKEDAI